MIDALQWALGVGTAFAAGAWTGFKVASRHPLRWLDDPRAWTVDIETEELDKTEVDEAITLRKTGQYPLDPKIKELLDRCHKDRL